MALFLNKLSNGSLSLNGTLDESTIAKIDYEPVNQNPDRYTFHYVSFKTPKRFIKSLKVLFYNRRSEYDVIRKTGYIEVEIETTNGTIKTKFEVSNPIGAFKYGENIHQEKFVEDFLNLVYSFESNEDVIEICEIKHPTEYKDAISLSAKISTIAEILNRLEKDSKSSKGVLKWLKAAFLRFDILLKETDEHGQETMFATLNPILAKHGYALFNR